MAQPFYVKTATVDAELAQRLQEDFKKTLLLASPIVDFTPFYLELKAIPDDQIAFKLNILKLKFNNQHDKRVKRLKDELVYKRYRVFFDLLVPYTKELVEQDSVQLNFDCIKQLLILLESAWYTKQAQLPGHELLWHALLPLQNTLDTDRITQHFPGLVALHSNKSEINAFTYGESVLALQAIAQQISAVDTLEAVLDLIEVALALNHRLPQLLLTQISCELFKDKRSHLESMREIFEKVSDPIAAQKQFSADTLHFLNGLLRASVSLIGKPPFDMALCVLGSTSRTDRRPYSDLELLLLYQQPEHKKQFQNKHQQHLEDLRVKLYLYHLLGLLELAIVSLGESHIQSLHHKEVGAGFHLDSSCHILQKELFATPEQMANNHILLATYQLDISTGLHPWAHGERFFALLQPRLLHPNEYESQSVMQAYNTLIQSYLNTAPTKEDDVTTLYQVLKLPAQLQLANTPLKRRHYIALSVLKAVLDVSQTHLKHLHPGSVLNLKETFYKPLAYLALSLKLFYNLEAEHPVDIFEVMSQQLAWGQAVVFKLFSTALSFIAQLQNKLHLQAQQQEEQIVWLGSATANIPAYQILAPIDYAALDLIQHSLITPLTKILPAYFEKPADEFKNVLWLLLKQHLNQRNLAWFKKWTQHATHAVVAQDLFDYSLIKVLADYPSPNGWSPTYEQTMQRWLGQLQTLITEHETTCLIEGIPASNKQKTSSSYLPAEIVTQLFDTKGEFKGKVHDSKQSKVSQIIWPAPEQANAKTFYFKVKPGNEAGLMGREFAVINLHQLLGGQSHIASGWPLKLTYLSAKGPKVYYCWVSEGIPGKSLAEVMQAETDFVHFQAQLDRQSYSHLLVTHYLTCPEDAQPDNFKVFQPLHETKQILYGLDVGQSFVGTYDDKRKVLSVKTMLYLLEPAIHQALETRVLTRLMLLAPQALIKHWQANLKHMNQLFKSLFEAELAKTRVPKAQWSSHNQLVDLNEAVQLSVQKRLELLVNWLYQPLQKERSGALLLRMLEPAVALSYQSLRGKIKTTEDFYAIDPKAYVRNPNTGKMYSSTTYQQIQQQTLTPERLQASLGLDESYFATLDFRKITAEQEQHYVLAMLQAAIQNKQRFTYLNLAGCTILNEKDLLELLQKTTDLKELHLEDCLQFNLSTVLNIFSCKVNEKLISYLPLRWDYKVLCPQMRKLSVTLGGKVHLLEIALTLIGRKQLVTFITQQQQSVEIYIKRLLVKLGKEDDLVVRVAAAQSLGTLAMQLSPVQVERVVKALLAQLSDKDRGVRAAAAQSLGQLAKQLSPVQVERVVKAWLDGLSDIDKEVRAAAAQGLGKLPTQLSPVQVERVVNALLTRLGDKDRDVRAAVAQSLSALAAQLSPVQVERVVKALLAQLSDKDRDVRAVAAQSLGQLAAQLSPVQVESMVKALLDRLSDIDRDVRAAAAQSLGPLAALLSPVQVERVVKALLDLLRDKDRDVRIAAVKSLAEIFSVTTSLHWLQKNMLQIEQAAFKSLPESSVQTDQTILYKLFSFLDQKTLFEVVPRVNRDWQRWQKVYVQQQAQKMREQNFIFLEETPKTEVMDFHTRFEYSLWVNNANIQQNETFVNTNAKNAIQTNSTTTLGVTSKPIPLAQTNFFQLEKNIQVTVPKHYKVQTNQQVVVFEVKAVLGDGDCGYTAFGITRAQAYQLLVSHLEKIRHLIKPAVQEALRTQAFIDTLQREGRLTQALSKAYADYLHASHDREMPQQILDALDRAGEDLTILLAYIDYDVKAKQIDAGWSHPCILFALAEIQGIELHIWQSNEQAELVPHAQYPRHIPAQANTRTDLLFVNTNHFERLELIDNNVQLTVQPSNTNAL